MTSPSINMPYAPPASVIQVIKRYRERGLPDPVTNSSLEVVGIPSSVTSRVTVTLKFLGLIDESGHRTETFEGLKRANSTEYPSVLAEVLRSAYSLVFDIVNPELDDENAINDAFRRFEPSAQRARMVTLFMSLCSEAGLLSQERERRPTVKVRGTVVSRNNNKGQSERKAEEPKRITQGR
jgi:hypothetical protein